MTYSAAYFADKPATIRQQIGGLSWNWIMSRLLQVRVNRQVVSEAFEVAILAPSLIAEAAPLWLFWHSHLLVWQMSAIGRLLGLHMVANMDCSLGRQEPSLLHADSIEGRPKRPASSQSAKGAHGRKTRSDSP